jgi:putative protein kinase ArgK-like GTPase of G3E family
VVAQRGGQGRSDLPEPPFVGRDEELRLLKDLIATTGRDRRTRLVSITGPGGIGKSRLAWELEKYIDGTAIPDYAITDIGAIDVANMRRFEPILGSA